MFQIGDLVVHYMFGYLGVIVEITEHKQYPYVVHFVSYPHQDDDDFYPIEHCCEGEIKLLDNEKSADYNR